MKVYKTTALMLGILAFFTACATPPKLLAPHPFTQNISAINCEKLRARLDKLMADNDSFYPVQKKLALKDIGLVTGAVIGGIFILPIVLFIIVINVRGGGATALSIFKIFNIDLRGDGATALSIQKNKGEIDAIRLELDSERCA